jgi:TorA maturation chaperone TorD
MSPEALDTREPLSGEEQARAEIYALLARLFYAPPDAKLMQAIVGADELVAEEAVTPLALAWRDLKLACAASNEEAAREEYDSVFIGTGRAEVTPYLGAYLPRSAAGPFVVELKAFLDQHGLARRESVKEPEDHVAAALEVMRHFIAEDRASLEEQKAYFLNYLWTGTIALCEAIAASPEPRLYKDVARFTRSFLELEHTAFEIG